MKIKINLRVNKNVIIPINYQEYLSSSIYELIEKNSVEFAHFLKNKGYNVGYKHFRMFTFSLLFSEKSEIINDKIKFFPDFLIKWYIASPIEDILHHILNILFLEKYLIIANEYFTVESVEAVINPRIFNIMIVKPQSVIVFSKKRENKNAQYIVDDFDEISRIATRNLQDKYFVLTGKHITSEVKIYAKDDKKINSKLVSYKNIKIKGILDDLIIEGDKMLIGLAYHCGLGEKNSMGFGCIDLKGG